MGSRLVKSLIRSDWLRFLVWLAYLSPIDLAAVAIPVRRNPKTKKRVVLARLDGLGDYVLWTGVFPALEEVYPTEQFERILILDERWKRLAERDTIFDQEIFLDVVRLVSDAGYRFRTIRQIRSLDADIFVNAKLTRDFLLVDPLVRNSGSKIRIGCLGYNNRMTGLQDFISRRWYSRLVPAPTANDHEFDSNLSFLEAVRPGKDLRSSFNLGQTNGTKSSNGRGYDAGHILIFAGASSEEKRWPIEKFAETATFVSEHYDHRIVLAGGQNDHEFAVRFAERFKGEFDDTIGNATLDDLEEMVRGARLVISNDTGLAHISSMLKVPTIVVTPGNQIGRFFPYPESLVSLGTKQRSVVHEMPCFGCGWHCIYNTPPDRPKPCVENISVKDVNAAIVELLDESAGHKTRQTQD